MNILVIGGTGFIGQHIVDKLLAQDHQVICLSRGLKPGTITEHPNLTNAHCDIKKADTDELITLMQNIDTVVYAAGSDERVTPKGDAYDFFVACNITPMLKVLEAAKVCTVKSVIVLNSMFSYLDREYPEIKLSQHHPYIRSRVDQRNIALSYASKKMSVAVFEIPYVFGATTGKTSQWSRLIDYIRISQPILLTTGGANIVNVKTIANAVNTACTQPFSSGCYPIGDENLTWQQLTTRLANLMGLKKKHIKILSVDTFSGLSRFAGFLKSLVGIHSGLDNKYMADIVTMDMFFDSSISQKQLGFKAVSLDEALQKTIATTPKKSTLQSILSLTLP